MSLSCVRKYAAECFATSIFVFFACGCAVFMNTIGMTGTALACGLALALMRYTLGNITVCHLNPAVSLGFLLAGRLSVPDFFGYVAAQFVGAFAGAGLAYYILDSISGLGAGYIPPHVYIPQALVLEAFLVFVFVFVFLIITAKKDLKFLGDLLIGLSLTLVLLLGQPIIDTTLNPARALAPALLAGGEWIKQVWIFLVAPFVGGALAAWVVYPFRRKDSDSKAS